MPCTVNSSMVLVEINCNHCFIRPDLQVCKGGLPTGPGLITSASTEASAKMFSTSLETDRGLLSQLVKFYQNFNINPQMVSPNGPWSIYCLPVNTSNNKKPVISKSNESIPREKVKPLRHKLLLNLQVKENRSLKWLHLEDTLYSVSVLQLETEREDIHRQRESQRQKQRHEKEKKRNWTIERKRKK